MAAFLTLLRNMFIPSSVNQDTLLRENAIATLAHLLQNVDGHLLDGMVLAPGELGAVRRQTADAVGFTFGIGCGSDAVRLLDPEGRIRDQVEVPRQPRAYTWGRKAKAISATCRCSMWMPRATRPGKAGRHA